MFHCRFANATRVLLCKPAPPSPPMGVLEVQWSRPLSLVCEWPLVPLLGPTHAGGNLHERH